MSENNHHSYIRRRGRITKAQQEGLDQLPAYRSTPQAWAASEDGVKRGMEIGFGMGDALLSWAQTEPEARLLGIELYQPGLGALVHRVFKEGIENVTVIDTAAQEVVAELPDECLDEVRIFFPDPWPKKRHFKRRLIQLPFVQDLARAVKPGGIVHLATDWTPYAEWMLEVIAECEDWQLDTNRVRASAELSSVKRDSTKFERRGERLGHEIHDLIYRKVQSGEPD